MKENTDTLYDQDSDFTTETACNRRALKRHKREDRLRNLAEASFNEHDTL